MFNVGERVLLVVCGSFNPVTNMHLRMLEVAKDALVERGCVVEGGLISPVSDGYGKAGLLPAEHRVAMLREAVASSEWITVSDWESSLPTWTRTVAVLEHQKKAAYGLYGDDVRVALVVGGDVVETFPRLLANGQPLWAPEDLKDIIVKYGLVVLKRHGSHPEEILKQYGFDKEVIMATEEVCPNELSSTRVRAAVAKGKSIRYAVPDSVANYITSHSLYKKT